MTPLLTKRLFCDVVTRHRTCQCPVTVVSTLDNGDSIELVDLDEREVKVDWDDDGKSEYFGWVGPDDGLLLYD